MCKRLQLLKVVGFVAASDYGFDSCALVPLFHVSCFKLEYFIAFSTVQITGHVVFHVAQGKRHDFIVCWQPLFEFILPFSVFATKYWLALPLISFFSWLFAGLFLFMFSQPFGNVSCFHDARARRKSPCFGGNLHSRFFRDYSKTLENAIF